MADAPIDNPAGRLHKIMSRLLAADGGQQILQMLRDQLGIGDEPWNVMVTEIGKFLDLAPETYRLIGAIEGENPDILLRWMEHFNAMLPWVLRSNEALTNIQSIFTEADLYALEVCADLLHRKCPEAILDEDKIPDIIELVREAIDAISEDEGLSMSVRMALIDRLREVERALLHIHTAGYGGVESAMDRFTGTLFREPQASTSTEAKGWWHRLWTSIGLAAAGVKAIGESIESTASAIEAVQQQLNQQ